MASDTGQEGRSTLRKIGLFVLVGLLTPIAVALISAGSIAAWEKYRSGPSRTETRLFVPSEGRYTVSARETGTCNVESSANPGVPEAHRCVGQRYLHDPCWGVLDTKLLCIWNPWTTEATEFNVTGWSFRMEDGSFRDWNPRSRDAPPGPLFSTDRRGYRASPPWALELENGLHCVLTGGATYTVAGERANYFCGEGDDFRGDAPDVAWVIGIPDKSSPLWVVSLVEKDSGNARQVEVHKAWY